MTSLHPIYHGHTGQASARFRRAMQPPGYRTAKGTAGHYLASPADTDRRFSLYRWDMSPTSGGPGPHFHRTYAEPFYVPAGGIHGFTNTSGAPASMLMLLTPGADRAAYFAELAHIAADGRERAF